MNTNTESIDVIVGLPVTGKYLHDKMPKFYTIKQTNNYDTNPIQTTTNTSNTDYTISSTQKNNPINMSYLKTDNYDTKQEFISTETETPKFDKALTNYNMQFSYKING